MSRKASASNKAARFLKEKLGDAKRELRIEQELGVILRRENDALRQELLASNSYAVELLRELRQRDARIAETAIPMHLPEQKADNAVAGTAGRKVCKKVAILRMMNMNGSDEWDISMDLPPIIEAERRMNHAH